MARGRKPKLRPVALEICVCNDCKTEYEDLSKIVFKDYKPVLVSETGCPKCKVKEVRKSKVKQ